MNDISMKNNENLVREALLRVLFGEPWEDVVDNIKPRLGEEVNSNSVNLPGFSRIEIKMDGELLYVLMPREFFYNPPPKYVYTVRDILKRMGINLISRRDFISARDATFKADESILLVKTEEGFWETWIIVWEGITCGAIKISGNFWDRSTDLVIDIPTSAEKAVKREIETFSKTI